MSNFKAEAPAFDKGETPKLPAKLYGEVWHTGWDIPSYWAIDADNVPYADYGAHGCNMTKTTFDELITHMESEGREANDVRKLAGLRPKLPDWAKTALNFKWTPPPDFKMEDYDDGKREPKPRDGERGRRRRD